MLSNFKLVYKNNLYDFPRCKAKDEKQACAYFSSWLKAFEPNYWVKKYIILNLSNGYKINCDFDFISKTGRKYFNKIIKEYNL